MHELTTRIQRIEDEIATLRHALRRLRDAFAEADRIREAQAAVRPAPLTLVHPVRLPARVGAMPGWVSQAIHADSFVFTDEAASKVS